MKYNILKCFGLALLFMMSLTAFSQSQINNKSEVRETYIDIRGSVKDKNSYEPYKDVEILVNGGHYTRSNLDGTFNIKARIGDEIIISHPDFETIYYTVTKDDRLSILVEGETQNSNKSYLSKRNVRAFNQLIDSADVYLKKDASKAVQFVSDALKTNNSSQQNAEAHELIGDIYTYWKQYDLAISAYKISLQNAKTNSATLKLAEAYFNEDNTTQSISTYNSIKVRNLSNYQKTEYYEGLGDALLQNKEYDKAITTFKAGLKVAQDHLIKPKITDLNTKTANAYNAKGDKVTANTLFRNSLNLAQQENKKRAIEAQITVAEFDNSNANYESEIDLRKQVLNDIEDIRLDTLLSNESPLTPQKQNYKIADAYNLNNQLEEAVPYLEKSIEEADKRGDLVVKKDALRKLSDVEYNLGNTDKAFKTVEAYKNVVDELYVKKEQEISQVVRFSKNLAEQQNRITSLESDRALNQSKYELSTVRNKTQQIIIYALLGGLLLFLITVYFMYKSIKQQKLANNLLALKSLRSQMNPHFIFNALNSVNSFIATNDERTANKYLSDFSRLMRSVLENSEEDFITLKKEIELIKLYTKLEHFRFQDKFDYNITINESIAIEDYKMPPMLLQPYIENAVWHGLRYKTSKGKLLINIQPKSEDQITISIIDDGIGRARSKALKTSNQMKQKSKGMSNIKKRVQILNEMYKDKVDVTIEDVTLEDDTGTKVIVTLKKN